MLDRLRLIEKRYRELEERLADPEVLARQSEYREVARTHAEIAPIVEATRRYEAAVKDAATARELLGHEDDESLREYLQAEAEEKEAAAEAIEQELHILLLPKDPDANRNVIVEIRGAAGGDEAKLFAGDLFRMYQRFAESRAWKTEVLASSPTGLGGFNDITFEVKGDGAFGCMKHEGGTHRVQRIPSTESGGRIHTSTATVAVLPEAEEVDVEIDPKDVRVDVFRSSGPGGQSVNTTDSAVRLTYLPTGTVVSCQDEKSQLQNKEKAMRILRSRLLAEERERAASSEAATRRSQIGTGDRSEKVRTYNFPQNRVTDHRLQMSVHNIEAVMNGDLDSFVNALVEREQAQLIEAEADAAADSAP
ncbi:MAG: peptide chain release factor 1 [Acidobacteria bacterium]|nr:MAG: peptide chain release factor 1 [Acidobacteriota bacterium]